MSPKKRKASPPSLIIRPLHIQQGQPVARVETNPNVNLESGQRFSNTPPSTGVLRPIAVRPAPIVAPILGTPPSTPKKGKGRSRKNIANFTRNHYSILNNYLPNSLVPVAPQSQLYLTP